MASCVVPVKRKADEDAIRCICGLDYDDGFSIACDACSRWCHAACFNIVDGAVPEEWLCWLCNPRPVDSDTTRTRIQRQREVERQRRRSSPGIERKARRPSTVTDEPSTHAYVPIAADIVHPDARARLHRHAHHWRGVSALASPADNTSTVPVVLPNTHNPSPTTLRQIPPAATSPDVRPPTYAVHTAAPVPSDHLITPFTSSITPSSAYLADPLNAYAHLGMPKPFVHLIGPPLDIALDARITGDSARFVRSGCRPNAVLRPVLCPHNDSDSLSFGVFALRDLKANEEVVLGWEWDDGNAIHSLPALIEAPHTFPHPSPSDSPHQVQYLRNQMSNILHALSSTFTTCACGSKTKTCVVNQMAAFVDDDHSRLLPPDNVNLGPLVGKKRGFRTRERLPFASGLGGVEMCDDSDMHVDPLPNFVVEPSSPSPDKGKGKAKSNGLLHNDIIARPTLIPRSSSSVAPPRMQRSSSRTSSSSENNTPLPEPDPPDEDRMPPKMRKRWKREIRNRQRESASYSPAASLISHGSTDPGVETTVGLEICIEEAPSSSKVQLNIRDMPPPPLPSTSHLASFDGISPSADFSRLSIVSPRIDSTQSPFQPWAPFERKAQLPLQAVHQEDKMDVDIDTHTHTPSARSPQTSISPRSRSRSPHSPRQHLHPSPTSTAITTPPSPREPKLPDVIPLSPPPSQRPIADSPESPPNISIDTPSPMTPIIPIPPEDHQSEDEMQIDETEDERQITPPPRPLHPELTPSPPPLHPPKSPSSISFSPASPSPSPPPYSPEQIPPLPELEPLQRSESPREPTVTPTFTPAREASRTPTPTPAVLPRVESEQALGQTPEPQSTIEVHPETERASTPTPVAPEPDASPSTPQPQTHAAKVKLSLKDFAARKKKMQKEVGGGLMSADASPRVGGMAGLGEKGGVLAASPSLGVKELGSGKDLVNEGLVAPARPASVGALTSSLFGKGFSTKMESKPEAPSTTVAVTTASAPLPIKLHSEMRPTHGQPLLLSSQQQEPAKEWWQKNERRQEEKEDKAWKWEGNRTRVERQDTFGRFYGISTEMEREPGPELRRAAPANAPVFVPARISPQVDGWNLTASTSALASTPISTRPVAIPSSTSSSSSSLSPALSNTSAPLPSSTISIPPSTSTSTPIPTPTPTPAPTLAPISIPIPIPTPTPTPTLPPSIPTAPRAHRELPRRTPTGPAGYYAKTPTGPRSLRVMNPNPSLGDIPTGPALFRDVLGKKGGASMSTSMNAGPPPPLPPLPPPPPNTSPPPQPPPPPSSSSSFSPVLPPAASPSLPFLFSMSPPGRGHGTAPQAPRAFSRSFVSANATNGNGNGNGNSAGTSPPPSALTFTLSSTPTGMTSTTATTSGILSRPPPSSSTSSTASNTPTSSTPVTPTRSTFSAQALPPPLPSSSATTSATTIKTPTVPDPTAAGLPSRPLVGLGLGGHHHLSSSHPLSMMGTSMATAMVPKRPIPAERRVPREREDRDRDRSRDRFDRERDRDRDRDNRDRDRDRDREYRDRDRDRTWPRLPPSTSTSSSSSSSSRREWDSWGR